MTPNIAITCYSESPADYTVTSSRWVRGIEAVSYPD